MTPLKRFLIVGFSWCFATIGLCFSFYERGYQHGEMAILPQLDNAVGALNSSTDDLVSCTKAIKEIAAAAGVTSQ